MKALRRAASRSTIALATVPLLTLSGCVGWGSESLPPALTPAEDQVVSNAHVPLTVGVERYVHPAYSDALVKGLRGTDLFDEVAPVDEFESPPDLVARVDRQISRSASIPLYTLLSFGLIPMSTDEEFGYSFWLGVPGTDGRRWHVEFTHTGRTTLGWVTLLDAVVPDRTIFPFRADRSRRMLDRVSLAILDHRDGLAAVGRDDSK